MTVMMPASRARRTSALDRQRQRRGRRDVAHVEHARPLRDAGPDRLDDLLRRFDRQRHILHHVVGAGALATVLPCLVARAILVVRGEHLVAGFQLERARDDVDAQRGVRDEGDIVWVGADEWAQSRAGLGEQIRQPLEKLDGLAFELELARLVGLEYGPRARAEGAVVEKDDVRLEQEQLAQTDAGGWGQGV